jgi:hypothetical protein
MKEVLSLLVTLWINNVIKDMENEGNYLKSFLVLQ